MTALDISVVIPTIDGRVDRLLASLARQTLQPREIEVVRGVVPSGRARNVGLARTTGPIVVFIDDDAVLPQADTLAELVAPLAAAPEIAAAGAARLVPRPSSAFQRAVARQVPRVEQRVVDRLTESNPPVRGHGYTELTTTCCAVRRVVLDACGGFDERLVRGVDSEFFRRAHTQGHRLFLVPTWVEHPAPASVPALLRKHFWYGVGYAQEVHLDPTRGAFRRLRTPLHAAFYLAVRTFGLVPHAFVPYTAARPSWRTGFEPLTAIASYAAAVGYVYGWYRWSIPASPTRTR